MKKQQQKTVRQTQKPKRFKNIEAMLDAVSMTPKVYAMLPVESDSVTSPRNRQFHKKRLDGTGEKYKFKPIIQGMENWPPNFIKAYINLIDFGLRDFTIGPKEVFAILDELFSTTWEGTEKYRLLRHVDDIS